MEKSLGSGPAAGGDSDSFVPPSLDTLQDEVQVPSVLDCGVEYRVQLPGFLSQVVPVLHKAPVRARAICRACAPPTLAVAVGALDKVQSCHSSVGGDETSKSGTSFEMPTLV